MAVMAMIDETGLAGFPAAQLSARAGTEPGRYQPLVAMLERSGQAILLGSAFVSSAHLDAARRKLLAIVTDYHAKHPIEDGIAREELRERVCGDAAVTVFEHLVTTVVKAGTIVARGRVALAGRSTALTDQEVRARDTIAQILHESGLTPPDPAVLASRTGLARELVDRVATLLIREKVLVRLGDLLFHESALSRLKADIATLRQQGTVSTLDVAVFKDRYQMTRKHAIPLLEFLDRAHVTRRVGNTRQIL